MSTLHNTEIIKNIAQTLGWLIAAGWVLMNYRRDRTHVPRLQIDLKTTLDRYHLAVTISVKNPGRSMATISNKGSALLIYRLKNLDTVMEVEDPEWDLIGGLELFANGRSPWTRKKIEPGITLKEQQLIRLPIRRHVYFVRLMVTTLKRRSMQDIWRSPSIRRVWRRLGIQRIWRRPDIQRIWNQPAIQRIWRRRGLGIKQIWRRPATKVVRETEAEAIAFVISKAVGLETGSASADYIQLPRQCFLAGRELGSYPADLCCHPCRT
jgi:hypothetical protein